MPTTLAAVVRAPGEPVRIEEVALPELGPGLVRVRMAAAGVCHSDLSLASGKLAHPMPAVLGHEGVGHVVDVGACPTCPSGHGAAQLNRRGLLALHPRRAHLCANAADASRRVWDLADGTDVHPCLVAAFAQETVVPQACVAIPADIPTEAASAARCSPGRSGAQRRPGASRQSVALTAYGRPGVSRGASLRRRHGDRGRIRSQKKRSWPVPGATHFLTPAMTCPAHPRPADGRESTTPSNAWAGLPPSELPVPPAAAAPWWLRRGHGHADPHALEIPHFARTLQGALRSSDPATDVPELLKLYRGS